MRLLVPLLGHAEVVQHIRWKFVAEHDLGPLLASNSIPQQAYYEVLVRLIHVKTKVHPVGVISTRLTPAKLMLQESELVLALEQRVNLRPLRQEQVHKE